MGCSATKVTMPVTEPSSGEADNSEDKLAKSSDTFVVTADGDQESEDFAISARTPNGLAFEVPMSEEEIIMKHPPKRFQRLEDQQMSSLTHRLLDEKQAEAEQRRLQILSQRVQSAKSRQKLKRSFISNSQGNDLFIESMHREPTTVAL